MKALATLAKAVDDSMRLYGTPVTYRAVTPGAYTPGTGQGAETLADLPVTAILADSRVKLKDGAVRVFDAVLYFRGVDIAAPSPLDRVLLAGAIYTVEPVQTFSANGQPVMHIVGCMK